MGIHNVYTLWRNRVRWLSVLPFFIFQFLWRYVIYASHTVLADPGQFQWWICFEHFYEVFARVCESDVIKQHWIECFFLILALEFRSDLLGELVSPFALTENASSVASSEWSHPIPTPGRQAGIYQTRARRCKYRCVDTSRTHKVIHTCACIFPTFANLSSVYLSHVFVWIFPKESPVFPVHPYAALKVVHPALTFLQFRPC